MIHTLSITRSVKHDHATVERVVRTAHDIIAPTGSISVNIRRIQRGNLFCGTAWPSPPSISPASRALGVDHLVVLKLPARYSARYPRLDMTYPGKSESRAPWPRYDIHTWEEDLFHLAAHEFAHCVQFARGEGLGEIEAEQMATAALEHWRSHPCFQGPTTTVNLEPSTA